jgi:phosphate-selective porin OprO/OprP
MSRLSIAFLLGTLASLPTPASAQAADSDAADVNASEDSSGSEWSIKPRGRLQLDVTDIDAPSALAAEDLGTESEVRRAYLGVDGSLPGNLSYRLEADFAGSSVQLTDAYLAYKPTQGLTLTLGQQKPFFGLEEQTSDLFTSMMERAAFTSAFGFERRLGFSGAYSQGDLLIQLGAFTVNAANLDADEESFSVDGRVVFNPEVGPGTLHIGGSAHWRDLDDTDGSVRYRARPFTHATDTRLIDTGALGAGSEHSFGVELAYVAGPFHATLEGHRITAVRPGLPNPSFAGGYAEVGLLLTPGDTTGYKGGTYDRIKPARPVTEGGPGAIQLNARYDRLDLNDEGITGGLQQTLGLSAVWALTDSLRLQANYGHLWVSDAAISAGTDPDYQADVVGLRAQIDF